MDFYSGCASVKFSLRVKCSNKYVCKVFDHISKAASTVKNWNTVVWNIA